MQLIFYYFFLLFLTLSKLLVLSLCAFSCLLFGVLSLSVMLGGWVWWRPRRGPPTSNRSASTKPRFPNPAPPAATIKAQQAKKLVANTTNAAIRCARKPLPHKLEQNPWVIMFIFAKNFVLLVVLVGLIQLIRRLAVKPSDAVSDWDLGGWVWVANLSEVSGFGLPIFWRFLAVWYGGYGCRFSGSVVMVAGCLVRWWCGGDAVMVAGCV